MGRLPRRILTRFERFIDHIVSEVRVTFYFERH